MVICGDQYAQRRFITNARRKCEIIVLTMHKEYLRSCLIVLVVHARVIVVGSKKAVMFVLCIARLFSSNKSPNGPKFVKIY